MPDHPFHEEIFPDIHNMVCEHPTQQGSIDFCRAVGCSRELVGKEPGDGTEESDAAGTEIFVHINQVDLESFSG